MSHLRFDGRVVVVTGAGSGLGERIAVQLAERGARVVVNDADAGASTEVVHEIEHRGGTAIASGDKPDTPEGAQAVVAAALAGFGAVDVVVHHARPSEDGSSHALLSGAEPGESLRGLFAGIWVAHAAWAHMREARYGRLVMICPMDRSIDEAQEAVDALTGPGLVGLLNILKLEGADRDLKANMVVPGPTGDPVAVADLVTYLAHEECAPTGELFAVERAGLARLFVGVTRGIYASDLTMETVHDRVNAFMDPGQFIVPDEASEEITLLMADLR